MQSKATTAELPYSTESPAEVETSVSVAPSGKITQFVTPGCRHGQGGQVSSSRVEKLPVRCTRRTMEQRSEWLKGWTRNARWVAREVRTGDS